MVVGTSTGSIIAAALACNIDPDKILSLYKDIGKTVFKRPRLGGIFLKSKYSSVPLAEALEELFGSIKLGDIKLPLIIPATDIGNGGVHVFKSAYSNNFVRDHNVYVKDAVLASCSAPIFFNPSCVNEYFLADGGLWANNPCLVATIDAKKRLGIDLKNIQILTVGTGHARKNYSIKEHNWWGFFSGWGQGKFVEFILSLQSQSSKNYLGLLLDEDQIVRIDFETDLPIELDSLSDIIELISRADKEFRELYT